MGRRYTNAITDAVNIHNVFHIANYVAIDFLFS